jgi:hypothetical protein
MTAAAALSLADIDDATSGRLGVADIACPLCGPSRHTAANRRRPVMRVWRLDPSYATYHCARCGESGSARDGSGARRPIDARALARAQMEAGERERIGAAERLATARWLWSRRRPDPRQHHRALPALRPRHQVPAAGDARIPPGERRLSAGDDRGVRHGARDRAGRDRHDVAIHGVHLTHLLPDGSDRERSNNAKIMIGRRTTGWPIVLAPPNDLLGMAITEGIEDALSIHAATGLGAWTAGCASRLPALASAVPSYIDCVTVYAHDDDGRRHSLALADALRARDFEVFIEGLGK